MPIRSFPLLLAIACAPTSKDPTEPSIPTDDPVGADTLEEPPVVDTDHGDTDNPMDVDTDPPAPVATWSVVGTVATGTCEPSGVCWDNTDGPGLWLHDLHAVDTDEAWMRHGWNSLMHYRQGDFFRVDLPTQIDDMAANADGAWFLSEGFLHRVRGHDVLRFGLEVPAGFDLLVAVSPAGQVAVGGPSGALGFDGTAFTSIGVSHTVEAMNWQYELWIEGSGSTQYHDGSRWVDGPGMFLVEHIHQPAPGEAWLSSIYSGLTHVIGGQWTPHDLPYDASAVVMNPLHTWVLHYQEVLEFTSSGLVSMGIESPITEIDGSDLHGMGIGTAGRLVRLEDRQPLTSATHCGRIHDIVGTDADNLIAGCENALLHKENGQWRVQDIGTQASVYDVAVQGDTTWAITYQELLGFTPGEPTTRIPISGGYDVEVDHEGTLWVGTTQGPRYLDNGTLIRRGPSGLTGELRAGPDALYGVGGYRLWRFQDGDWEPIGVNTPWWIHDILPSADGGVVIAGWEGNVGGIMAWDTQNWRTLAPTIPRPIHLTGDPSTTLWVAEQNGGGLYEVRQDVVATTHAPLTGMNAWRLLDDGTLVVGTVEGSIGMLSTPMP